MIGVGFINRTPYRVIATYGGYDPQDQHSIATLGQLGVTQALDLEPNGVSRTFSFPCTRAFTVGGRRLLELIEQNELKSTAISARTYPSGTEISRFLPSLDLLKEGIGFSGAPFGDAQASIPTQGTAAPIIRYLGPDYLYGSILIFSFVENPAAEGGFSADSTSTDALGVDIERLVQLSQVDRALALAPLGLDRQTFQILMGMEVPVQTQTSLLTRQDGGTLDKAELTIRNQHVGTIVVALFGQDNVVVKVTQGSQENLVLEPGFYEYLIAPPITTSPGVLSSQFLDAGGAFTMTLLPAST